MLTQKDFDRLYGKVKTNKYGNYRIETPDGSFDSQKEYARWNELKLLQLSKAISGLERQKEFVLIDKSAHGGKIVYKADFVYYENGKMVVEDVKTEATKTPLYRLKKRLLAERYGIVIKEIL